MRWKSLRKTRGVRLGQERRKAPRSSDLTAELQRRGLPPSSCQAILPAVEARVASLSPDGVACLLDGVALAFEFHQGTHVQLLRTIREVQEVEKMMGAFSGELLKLDEVLEVLSAYVRRMRSSGWLEDGEVLH